MDLDKNPGATLLTNPSDPGVVLLVTAAVEVFNTKNEFPSVDSSRLLMVNIPLVPVFAFTFTKVFLRLFPTPDPVKVKLLKVVTVPFVLVINCSVFPNNSTVLFPPLNVASLIQSCSTRKVPLPLVIDVELISKFPGVGKVEFFVIVMEPLFKNELLLEISIPPLEIIDAPVFT